MTKYPFYQVDVFTTKPLAGNPCAVILNADALTVDEMLSIAREMFLPETAFVQRSTVADFKARYFTPAEEIPMAGHPTIATIIALIESGQLQLSGHQTSVRLELVEQIIPIEIQLDESNQAIVTMLQRQPEFLRTYPIEEVISSFSLSREDIIPGAPIQTVSTGTPQLMVPVRSTDILQRIEFNIPEFRALRKSGDFFNAHLFCVQGITPEGDTAARDFSEPPDIIEDPFTGSATGGMAAYLWKYALIDKRKFIAEQGHWMQRPGSANVEISGARDAISGIKVGGSGVVSIVGELMI